MNLFYYAAMHSSLNKQTAAAASSMNGSKDRKYVIITHSIS
jgi:hypothetical protein